MPKGGDPLCPLGFHPQVRWPTRCKRCFRDYKEHTNLKKEIEPPTNLRKDDVTGSAPSLQEKSLENYSRLRESSSVSPAPTTLSYTQSRRHTSELPLISEGRPQRDVSRASDDIVTEKSKDYSSIYSSLSTPALERLGRLRQNSFPVSTSTGSSSRNDTKDPDSRRASFGSSSSSSSESIESPSERGGRAQQRVQIQSLKEVRASAADATASCGNSPDVAFILEVKKSAAKKLADDETSSIAGTELTETTETTLVEGHLEDLQDQISNLRKELDRYKSRCERLEREKDDLTTKKTRVGTSASNVGGTTSEIVRLQQRIRELEANNEDLTDDKRSAELRAQELERELESRPSVAQTHKATEELKAKLSSAEAVIEELVEENAELKKEMRQLVEEMDEMQDNFREDQVDEYRDLKKELEQTAKNCRILQFKLRKSERRIEQLEAENNELHKQQESSPASAGTTVSSSGGSNNDRCQQLEQELLQAREQTSKMQKELQTLHAQLKSAGSENKKDPGPVLSKSRSLEGTSARGKVKEESANLQRDLEDSREREADLREQLKFAEEEAQSLRKKLSRVEEENESLVMQLKKMAMKKGRRPTPDASIDKDEGISDEMDDLSLSELKLQLELNEQETAVLRRKVEEMESENERLSREVLELQEKTRTGSASAGSTSDSPLEVQQRLKAVESDLDKLRTEIKEKDKEIEHLNEALSQAEKKKVVVQRSRSLDSESALDLKRQLTLVEQEAAILRSKITDLETDNEKLTSENRRMQLRLSRKPPPTASEQLVLHNAELEDRIKALEKKLAEASTRISAESAEKSPRLGRSHDRNRLSPNGTTSEASVLKREKEILEKELKSREEENAALKSRLQNVEQEEKVKPAIGQRTPKKPSETMTKVQLKKMIEELETEISQLLPKVSAADSTTEELRKTKAKLEDIAASIKVEKEAREKLEREKRDLENKIKSMEEKMKTTGQASAQSNVKDLQDKVKNLEREKADLERKCDSGNYVDLDTLQKVKQEKHKLQKELTEKDAKITDMERRIKDMEDKNKKVERSVKEDKERINQLEKELEEERSKLRQNENTHKEMSLAWLKERDDLKKLLNESKQKIEELDNSISTKEKKIKDLELCSKEEARKATEQANKKADRDLKVARDELSSVKSKMEDLEQKIHKAEQEKKSILERNQRQEADWRKEREQLLNKFTDVDIELKTERKRKDRLEKEHEQEIREKDDEVMSLRERLKRSENELRAATERYEELKNQDSRARELELELERERQEYEDLTAKYDLLEEDYVVVKARLVMDKEKLESEMQTLKKEYETVEGELRTLRETFNLRQDTWIKEKLDMQEHVKELEEKVLRSSGENWYIERTRLKDIIDEKTLQIEKLKREEEALRDQLATIRKDNDEVRRKLEDFDKVTKVQRSMTVDTSTQDREIRELRNKLSQEEKAHRSEMTHLKMRYDNRIALLQEETQAAQMQLEKARRERDTLREMLEGAQRMIADLKNDPAKQERHGKDAARTLELEENLARIEEFHARITSLEDELSEARLECSRVKTEYINSKSAWEIKMAEMQTKINELEEDKVMATGRSRIPGTKTRLELAWQKEREEQQRLIQETSTLARDLRQTLLEVEKERDRERLEYRRRQEQLKRGAEEEQQDIRKKISELQTDLLELRDAHAKLRTTCEKLRRDKERLERERDDSRRIVNETRRAENEEERRLQQLLQEVQKMKDLCPLVLGAYLSKDSQPDSKKEMHGEKVKDEFLDSLRQITQCTEDIRRLQQRGVLSESDLARRTMSFRRAMSSTPDEIGARSATSNGNGTMTPQVPKRQSVYKRSLSLEQSQAIEEGEASKDTSSTTGHYGTLPGRSRTVERDPSLDRLSLESTQSESAAVMATPDTKKKRSIMGKIKQLAKSRSIEETHTADSIVTAGIKALVPGVGPSGSDLSLESRPEEGKKEKKTVKDKIAGVFRKATSRSNSMERSESTDRSTPAKDANSGANGRGESSSSLRPLMRPPSVTNLSSQTPSMSRGTTPTTNRASKSSTLRSQSSIETNV